MTFSCTTVRLITLMIHGCSIASGTHLSVSMVLNVLFSREKLNAKEKKSDIFKDHSIT